MEETLDYNAWGNLWKRTDFAGKTTTFAYDALNRLKSKTADATHASLGYSHAIARVEYDYDANGARKAARTYNAADTLLYSETTPRDERGRVDYKQAPAGTLDYSYYANNLLKDVVSGNSDGVNVGYRYDALNRLAHVDDATTGTTVRSDYTYNDNGSLETLTQPNGVVHTYGYDALNRLRTLNVAKGSASIHAYDYKLRASGHRRQVIEGAKTTTYEYDALYRLTGETVAGAASAALNGAVSYELDKVGNRLARNSALSSLSSQLSQTYNARDWLNSDTYDANGSTLTSSQLSALNPQLSGTDTYDFENRLIIRTKPDGSMINVSYDADGIRIAKNILDAAGQPVSSTHWLVDTNNLTGYAQVFEETVTTSAGTTTRVYTYGTSLLSRSETLDLTPSTFTLRYYVTDGHGNVRELTDSTGAVTDTYTYDAFGNLLDRTGESANSYLYCGEQWDADVGLYYLRARYMNPDSGRFWSADAFEGLKSDPVSLHHYLYAHSEPILLRDPSGMSPLMETVLARVTAAVLQTMARVRVAFFFGAAAGGAALRNLGLAVENGALRILQTGGAQVTQAIRVVGSNGPRVIDMMAKIGERVALIEVKYKLPSRAGPQLNRLVSQMTAATESTKSGQQVVVFTFQEPQLAQLQLIHDKLGDRALTIQYVHGFDGLVRWMNFYFSIDG